MTESLELSMLLLSSVFWLFATSVGVFFWGQRQGKLAYWVIATGVFILFISCLVAWNQAYFINESGFQSSSLIKGWVLPREISGALLVGVALDPLSLCSVTLLSLIVLSLFFQKDFLGPEKHPARIYSAIGISTAGISLCWTSITPALSFVGAALCVFGGFVATESRWDLEDEAEGITRFVWEKIWGLMIAWAGGCIISGSRNGWSWHEFVQNAPAGGETHEIFGAIVLVLGLFVQFHSFPFSGWAIRTSQENAFFRVLLNQVFPGWAALSILLKTEPLFRPLNVFSWVGWVAIISCLLTIATGLVQRTARISNASWISAGLSLSLGLLSFRGAAEAWLLGMGVGLAGLIFSGIVIALEIQAPETEIHPQKSNLIKILSFFGISIGVGLIGFISFGGVQSWILHSLDHGAQLTLSILVLLFFGIHGWGLFWKVFQHRGKTAASWSFFATLMGWVLLGAGLIWTGHITGLAPSESTHPLLKYFKSIQWKIDPGNEAGATIASGLVFAINLVSFFVGFWLNNRRYGVFERFRKAAPRVVEFVGEGYHIDKTAQLAANSIIKGSRWIEVYTEEKWMSQGVLASGAKGLNYLGRWLTQADEWAAQKIYLLLRIFTDGLARFFQWLQCGDLQWMLLIALGSGFLLIAILLNI